MASSALCGSVIAVGTNRGRERLQVDEIGQWTRTNRDRFPIINRIYFIGGKRVGSIPLAHEWLYVDMEEQFS